MTSSARDLLRHMLDECRFATERLAGVSQPDFVDDETLKRALVRSLEIIGEAAGRLPDDIMARLTRWRSIAGMRDLLNSQYLEIDYDVVWDIVADELPRLRRSLEEYLRNHRPAGPRPARSRAGPRSKGRSRPREQAITYNAVLAERVRKLLLGRPGITESEMSGGVAYLLNGHMCCGVREELLILQLGEEGATRAIQEVHVHEVDFSAKAFKSMVCVDVGGYRSDADLRAWVTQAVAFVIRLPAK